MCLFKYALYSIQSSAAGYDRLDMCLYKCTLSQQLDVPDWFCFLCWSIMTIDSSKGGEAAFTTGWLTNDTLGYTCCFYLVSNAPMWLLKESITHIIFWLVQMKSNATLTPLCSSASLYPLLVTWVNNGCCSAKVTWAWKNSLSVSKSEKSSWRTRDPFPADAVRDPCVRPNARHQCLQMVTRCFWRSDLPSRKQWP